MFVQHNGGKQGLCVDLRRPEGLASSATWCASPTDVAIEAFTPGVMTRLGLGGSTSAASVRPRDVLDQRLRPDRAQCARPGYAHIAHSMTGWLAMQFLHRDPPERPRGPGIAIADVIAGITAFGAICAALFKRERTGRGEHIDVSLFDSLFAANDDTAAALLIDGG